MTLTLRPLSTLLALAAQLRLGALGLLVEVLAALGAGRLAAALRRRMARDIGRFEQFATGILVLMALKTLPSMPESLRGGQRPSGAPPGFARVVADDNYMRAMRRRLFPQNTNLKRDLTRRLRRLDALLDRATEAARRLARHIARMPPAARLVVVAAPVMRLASGTGGLPPALADTS